MERFDRCRICGTEILQVGSKRGSFRQSLFFLHHCPSCRFSFISNPCEDYDQIYSADYYAGKGADPLVDYLFELEQPFDTVRLYEWRGILKLVRSLINVTPDTNWLDFGCGNGGLVRYCAEQTGCHVFGFEQGWMREKLATYDIPHLQPSELDALGGAFDVVTAIEVVEHVADPSNLFERIRR